MAAPSEIEKLVERFDRNREQYLSPGYNEAQLRQEFLNPFFSALGWDIDNKAGVAEPYKEVIHEDSIKIGGETKAPDYGFRLGRERKFFVEAKRPSVNIRENVLPAFQLRRYAWTAKLLLSILTDFQEFAVYDCRIEPSKTDKATTARINYLRYQDYIPKWDEICAVFSRDAVWQGSFDKYVVDTRGKKGADEVDDAFLRDIESWRDVLARNIALRNPKLTVHELNFAVQRTIDRIIFLRICEDRGVETYGTLRALVNGERTYKRMQEVFYRADEKYNSGLFHFTTEKGRREGADELTLGLMIDDKPLKDIIGGLYYPDCPYEFSVFPADILGQVYEQFLGKVIRLTAGHQAKVEDKPDVKKAGGVYYTPTYIVDYIVKNTVGKLVEGKVPKQISTIRILDPACGSGSFLIGAYQYLLDWHHDWYFNDGPEKWSTGKNATIYRGPGGSWRLTTAERKRILLNNIFGVDIDSQAVEVTKLSLLLKVLEGENDQSISQQLKIFHERALPDLGENIKCGNSLIAPDFFEGSLVSDPEERNRINAFEWRVEFAGIMSVGGFSAVIGNPPYVRPHHIPPEGKQYFWKHFKSFVKKSDLYCCFIEQGISLLRKGGVFGFIVSDGWLRLDSFQELRRMLLSQTSIQTIVDFTDNVFEHANVKTLVMILAKELSKHSQVDVAVTPSNPKFPELNFTGIPQQMFTNTYKQIFDLSINPNMEKAKRRVIDNGTPLGKKYELSFGLKTGDDDMFLSDKKKDHTYKPLLRGANIHRYSYEFADEYVWYVPEKMREHRKTARPGTAQRFEQFKVLIRDTGGDLEGTYDDEQYYVKDVLVVSLKEPNDHELKYLCGILNSRLMKFYYESSFPTLHVQRDELASLPIHTINPNDAIEKSRYDRLVQMVNSMLKLYKDRAVTKTDYESTIIQREIDATDKQIDALVYELYGLTEEEIRIIEGSSN